MNNEYEFGQDKYIFNQNSGVKITEYQPIAPPQEQHNIVGLEYLMTPLPIFDNPNYKGSGKLKDKVAIITGGDSGLGRAAAIAYAKEGANVVIPYFNEHQDAEETKKIIEYYNQECLLLPGDISNPDFCRQVV